MSSSDQYQAIVIGSGQGGTPLCFALAGAGMRTALIEREHVGGTCINEGCTPTKTMVASGRVAYLARRGADYGVNTDNLRIDMARIRKRKRDIVDSFRNGSQARLEKTANLDLIFGEASFTGPKSVAIKLKDGSQRTISAEHIFINAGCRPATPPSRRPERCAVSQQHIDHGVGQLSRNICWFLAVATSAWNLDSCFAAWAAVFPSCTPACSCSTTKIPTSPRKLLRS